VSAVFGPKALKPFRLDVGSQLARETGFRQDESGLRNPIRRLDMHDIGHCWREDKKQGATGITTVAPYVAGQWGRGEDRLSG
jgi:hypothetical protein